MKAFEYGYLFKMVGHGYRQKYTTAGNDSRGIDVAVMMRNETAQGQPIEFVRMTSHAYVTLYLVHFKSMGAPRNGLDGRQATMPLRIAEAQAVRRIIEERFGGDHAADKYWAI